MTDHRKTTLGELATTLPAASRVFREHGLDYCCGGGRTLAEACEAKGLDAGRVLAEIHETPGGARDTRWDERPLGELLDHILERYHAPLRGELARLLEMARKVEERHADKPSAPRGLADHLRAVQEAVEDHLGKEENILFPMLREGRGELAGGPIQAVTLEHEDHGRNLARTRALTAELTAPPEACTTWRALYLGLRELEAELMDHIHLENNVLFPRALRGAAPRGRLA